MRNSVKHILFVLIFLWHTTLSVAQNNPDSSFFKSAESGLFPKKIKSVLENLTVSGYYRFLACYSDMSEQYAEMGTVKKRVFIGDDSNIPQLLLNIAGKPSPKTSFSTDFFLWTPLTGSTTDYAKGLNLGVNLTGTHTTKYGLFSIKTGGIHWHTLSPMTFATNTGYNRFSLFERNPWDPNTTNVTERYHKFYSDGALTQDVRWGQQAFQGFILEGFRLPQGFSFAFMHGKSQFNGGTLPKPNTITGGKIKKEFKRSFVSINGVTSKTYKDSLARISLGYNLVTTEFKWDRDFIAVLGEVGVGNYFSPTTAGKWGEAVDIKIQFKEKLTYFPIEIRYFQISPWVINNNGVFWNSSIQEYNESFSNIETPGSQTPLIPFASSLVSIGQLTNNRRGIVVNTDMNFKKQKLTIGYSAASEMSALSDRITYGHPANNLALSRFWRWSFPSNVGPYGNLSKIYRGVYETVQITDSITAKGFNSIEVSYKTEFEIFGKEMYIFYLGGLHSVQQKFSALPAYSSKAYIQSYNNQLEVYYHLFPKILVSGYLGYDRIFANNQTQLDELTQKPKNQEGLSYAFGLDIELAKNTGLYVRQRWFQYQDYNFSLDRYKGFETTIELKIYF